MSEPIVVEIEGLAAGGDGVGRGPDGRVIFVPFTAPGDRAVVKLVEERPRFSRGTLERLLEASPFRAQPLCGVYGECGGCAWQHLDYDTQVRAKAEILGNAIERIAKLPLPGPVDVLPSPSAWGYRSRARVLAKEGRVGYRRRNSHTICATSRCPVLVPALDQALAALSAQHPQDAEEWELSAGAEGSSRTTPLRQPLPEAPQLELSVCGDRVAFSPGVFVQGNSLLHDSLAQAVHEASGRGALAVELFCGAGFFTLGLARRFDRVVAVESEGRAVADLHANVLGAGLRNVEIRGGRAERLLPALPRADALLVDPPRTGLPPGCVEALCAAAPGRLVYVSCDPATLARDLRRLVDGGYTLESLRGFDLFPQTPHVEALATLTARSGTAAKV
jgi:23S rRNA (uracil1939-C5)-methyltransferase